MAGGPTPASRLHHSGGGFTRCGRLLSHGPGLYLIEQRPGTIGGESAQREQAVTALRWMGDDETVGTPITMLWPLGVVVRSR